MGQKDWCTCPDYAIDPACPKHGSTPEIANADAEEELTYVTITPPTPEEPKHWAPGEDETHVHKMGDLMDVAAAGRGVVIGPYTVIDVDSDGITFARVDAMSIVEPAPLGVLGLQDSAAMESITEEEGRKSLVLPITLEDAVVLYRELQDKVDMLVAAVMLQEVTLDEAKLATARFKRLLTGLNDIIVEATGRGRTSAELRTLADTFTPDQRAARLYDAARRGMAQR